MLPANVAGLSSILVPVVAMLSGALIHGEPLGALQWLGHGLLRRGAVARAAQAGHGALGSPCAATTR
jgi:hypothetical protein